MLTIVDNYGPYRGHKDPRSSLAAWERAIVAGPGRTGHDRYGRRARAGRMPARALVGYLQGAAELRGAAPRRDHPALGPALEPPGPAERPQPAGVAQSLGFF